MLQLPKIRTKVLAVAALSVTTMHQILRIVLEADIPLSDKKFTCARTADPSVPQAFGKYTVMNVTKNLKTNLIIQIKCSQISKYLLTLAGYGGCPS